MKIIKIEDAIGKTLCHDITKIVPGEFKGIAFKKGHVIKEEDINEFLSIGKDHIYIWEEEENLIHENEAAKFLYDVSVGDNLYAGEIKEGKIEIFAKEDGLLKIDVDTLIEINCIEEIVLSTIRNNRVVKAGEKVGATKVIPLTIEKEKLDQVNDLIKEKIIEVKKIEKKKIAIITTGSEVFYGRIKDASKTAIEEKISKYNCSIMGQTILPDDKELIKKEIESYIKKGADIVLCTGGMSVDADDVTPKAIKEATDEVVSYGTPIFPGAMFLVSYKGDIPVLGLPGGVIFSKSTTFDVLLPRILAGEKLTKRDIAMYSHGGMTIVNDY